MEIIKPGTNYDFIGKRKLFLSISGTLVAISVILLFTVGLNYGIDFAGGTEITIRFLPDKMGGKTPQIDEVREALKALKGININVQNFGDMEGEYLIKMESITYLTPEKEQKIKQLLEQKFGKENLKRFIVSTGGGDKVEFVLKKSAYKPSGDTANQDSAKAKDSDYPADAVPESEIRELFKKAGAPVFAVKVMHSAYADSYKYVVTLEGVYDRVKEVLNAKFGEGTHELLKLDKVGPRVGEKLKQDGILAVIYSLIGILIYIALRFEFKFAPGAVIALIHDVLITMGVFAALQLDFNLTTIAALLTIVGYSLNDTIVVYDRIRENYGLLKRMSIEEVFNKSINETLSRTILTSFTTFLSVAVIWFLTVGDIKNFAFAMMVGVIVGTYSSIFVASPMVIYLYQWAKAREDNAVVAKKKAASKKKS